MKTIRFEYKERGSVKYITSQIPDSLNEATGQQFTALLALAQGRIAEEPFFLNFFGIPEKVLHRLDLWQLYVLTEQVRDLWKLEKTDHFPVEEIVFPKSAGAGSPSAQPTGAVAGSGNRLCLVAPAAQLKGMSFQQFMTVDQFYQWHVYTGKQQYLMAMVAALYIEKGKEFGQTDIGLVAHRLEASPHRWLCEGLAFNWSMIRAWLSDAYGYLFPAGEEGANTRQAAPSGEGSGSTGSDRRVKAHPGSWLEIFDALVGDDLTRIESYKALPCMDVIRILNRRIKAQKK